MDEIPTVEDQVALARKRAKEDLDTAVAELNRVCQGTTMQFTLPVQLLMMQLDIIVDMLCTQELVDRMAFFEKVRTAVEQLTSDVRRAVLTAAPQQIIKTN